MKGGKTACLCLIVLREKLKCLVSPGVRKGCNAKCSAGETTLARWICTSRASSSRLLTAAPKAVSLQVLEMRLRRASRRGLLGKSEEGRRCCALRPMPTRSALCLAYFWKISHHSSSGKNRWRGRKNGCSVICQQDDCSLVVSPTGCFLAFLHLWAVSTSPIAKRWVLFLFFILSWHKLNSVAAWFAKAFLYPFKLFWLVRPCWGWVCPCQMPTEWGTHMHSSRARGGWQRHSS